MGTFDIFVMNADGSNIQRLTLGAGSNTHPSFSPDGRLITFSSSRAGGPAIFLMRADGSSQVRISKGNGLLPSWGPWKEKVGESK
jgi:TolB protein